MNKKFPIPTRIILSKEGQKKLLALPAEKILRLKSDIAQWVLGGVPYDFSDDAEISEVFKDSFSTSVPDEVVAILKNLILAVLQGEVSNETTVPLNADSFSAINSLSQTIDKQQYILGVIYEHLVAKTITTNSEVLNLALSLHRKRVELVRRKKTGGKHGHKGGRPKKVKAENVVSDGRVSEGFLEGFKSPSESRVSEGFLKGFSRVSEGFLKGCFLARPRVHHTQVVYLV